MPDNENLGGFVESGLTTSTRTLPTAVEIQAFLPVGGARGPFIFPQPWCTQGVRITNVTDCAGGGDEVAANGYSYWPNINNHAGSNTMYVFAGIDRTLHNSNGGVTLFSVDKMTLAVTKIHPLFVAPPLVNDSLSYDVGQNWYFSQTQPTTLYFVQSGQSYFAKIDVLTRVKTTIFDIANNTALYGTNKYIFQTHISRDDNVVSFTVKTKVTNVTNGAGVYRISDATWWYFPSVVANGMDECQIDKSGLWLRTFEDLDGNGNKIDMRVIKLSDLSVTTLMLATGAVGHCDNGWGYVVGDNNLTNRQDLYAFPLTGSFTPVYSPTGYNNPPDFPQSRAMNHISWCNAVNPAIRPLAQQYVLGSALMNYGNNFTRSNEVICSKLDGSNTHLIVCPCLSDPNAAGGSSFYYKEPKANLDPLGEWAAFTTNLGTSRLDLILVRIPSQKLFQ